MDLNARKKHANQESVVTCLANFFSIKAKLRQSENNVIIFILSFDDILL